MIRSFLLSLVLLASCCVLAAQESTPKKPTTTSAPNSLAAITARGRLLAEYDVAAWHATDAVEALKPDHAAAPQYLARKIKDRWEVGFGRVSAEHDRFLIVYRAEQGSNPLTFSAKKIDPPAEDRGFYFRASKAIETAAREFGRPQRPYNIYVLPSEKGELYVYFLPGQTTEGVYPLGGDVRYTVTIDGGTITNRRQMHNKIIEKKNELKPGQELAGGYHTHVLNNSIEDSDVFHVLNRKPPLPEIVGTPDKHVYEIATDGSIKLVK